MDDLLFISLGSYWILYILVNLVHASYNINSHESSLPFWHFLQDKKSSIRELFGDIVNRNPLRTN